MKNDEILKMFNEYRIYIDDNPLLVQDFVGKDGLKVYRHKARLLSMPGFRKYAKGKGINIKKLIDIEDALETIQDEILSENIEGAAAGIYAPSIVQRLHGLVESVEQTNLNKTIDVQFDLNNDNKIQEAAVVRLPKTNT